MLQMLSESYQRGLILLKGKDLLKRLKDLILIKWEILVVVFQYLICIRQPRESMYQKSKIKNHIHFRIKLKS